MKILIGISTLFIIEMMAEQLGASQVKAEINQKDNCDNPLTQTTMNICANLDYQEADARLNEIYQQVKREIVNDVQEQKLIKVQLSWIEFRDLNCNYIADAYRGGSIQPLIYYSCLTSLTEERIQHLELMVDNF
ncbi:lysozyme inhibitor LprI family protein [Xenococcus sp. PCC 7305]|uniref:lysozyme inhibitor LprI family protein n=1 Tax=Xenococcus sp. PCC 7305 TaxID=102125 RepID=UPI00130DCE4A|nr:lysozyme inhibitor LprI family protein [Xenococcus sp. PCC 7305]